MAEFVETRSMKIRMFIRKLIMQSIGYFYLFWLLIGFTICWLIYHPFRPFWKVKKRTIEPKTLTDSRWGEHKYITINNLKFHYVEKGDKKNDLMIFLHGYPESWYSWRYQLEEFAKDYWVIALDMRGYGLSAKPKDENEYIVPKLVSDVKELFYSTKKEKFILVGHDWGGGVAWNFILNFPQYVKAYIIMNSPTTASFNKIKSYDKSQFFKSWYIFLFQLPYFPELFMRANDFDILKRMAPTEKRKGEEDYIEVYKYIFRDRDAFTYPINWYRANFKRRAPKNLPKNKQETLNLHGLLIWGKNDAYLSVKLVDLMGEEFPNLQTTVIENAHHFVQQDRPDRVNARMREFLKLI